MATPRAAGGEGEINAPRPARLPATGEIFSREGSLTSYSKVLGLSVQLNSAVQLDFDSLQANAAQVRAGGGKHGPGSLAALDSSASHALKYVYNDTLTCHVAHCIMLVPTNAQSLCYLSRASGHRFFKY